VASKTHHREEFMFGYGLVSSREQRSDAPAGCFPGDVGICSTCMTAPLFLGMPIAAHQPRLKTAAERGRRPATRAPRVCHFFALMHSSLATTISKTFHSQFVIDMFLFSE
jgi:hypothetical protein